MNSFKEFSEAMTLSQRMKAKATFRRNKSKIAMGKKKAEKRIAPPEKLKLRARKAARRAIEKKLLGGKSKESMTFAGRQSLEKRVDKKKAAVDQLAKKLLPKIKKAELQKKRGGSKKESVNEALSPSQPVSAWIDDFVNSDAPQFQGKSKKKKL
jgi:hypothetical protein